MENNKRKKLTDNNEQTNDDNSNKEEIPKEVQEYYNKPTNDDNLEEKKKDLISETESEAGQPIGKKEMNIILLSLNPYWIELIGSIGFTLSLIIYEVLGLFGLGAIIMFLQSSFEDLIKSISNLLDLISSLGIKWFFFITLGQHLAVGFFCLSTFSYMLQEIKNIKKFFIVNSIKVALYYALSVIILKVIIKDSIGGFLINKLNETPEKDNVEIHNAFNNLIEKVNIIVADFLSTFNTFLDKLILGLIYVFLFYEPKSLSVIKLFFFRLVSLIPIIYIIISLVLRALNNFGKLELNCYLSPILLGPKIVVFLFFISTLVVIKYKSIKYNVFDSEDDISPKVFSSIGSKTFGFLGVLELIIGLFFPSWSKAGIGGKYLLVICAPIMALYDYKRKSPMKFPCCKKGNFSLFLKIIINFILYFIIVILGIFIALGVTALIIKYIKPIVDYLVEHLDIVGIILKEFF